MYIINLWYNIQKHSRSQKEMLEVKEYPKFRRLAEKNFKDNAIERWLAFLEKDISEETLKELVQMELAIQKAESKLEHLSSDEETMSIFCNWRYEEREDFSQEKRSAYAPNKVYSLKVIMNILEGLKSWQKVQDIILYIIVIKKDKECNQMETTGQNVIGVKQYE